MQGLHTRSLLRFGRVGAAAVPRRPLCDGHQPEQRGGVRREPGWLLQLRGRDGACAVQPGQPRAEREQHAVHGVPGGHISEFVWERQLHRVRRGVLVRRGQQRAAAGVVSSRNVPACVGNLQQRD